MKKCFKCKKRKPLTDFYKHPKMIDGRIGKCKECNKRDVRENRKLNINYYRAYDRERGCRQTTEYRKRYARENPIKVGARTMVASAVRDGRLQKPSRCEDCSEQTRLHGHHDDYANPMVVRWLCVKCHSQWHAKYGTGMNG